MRVAAKVRQEKDAHPERFCANRRCLWRIQRQDGDQPCPKHSREMRYERAVERLNHCAARVVARSAR